jgi:2-(1,2-epoxy-1,2-dihydrophenyl)acetyl-CoA isomerase
MRHLVDSSGLSVAAATRPIDSAAVSVAPPDYENRDGLGVQLADAVLRVTLDRPSRRNAITDEMIYDLIDLLERAGEDERVRALLVTGAGNDFCSGFDLSGRGGFPQRTGATQRRLPGHAHRLVSLLTTTQVPIVAAVRGFAAGVGLHVALAADFCVAADDARIWEPFVQRGFTPDSGGTWLVPRLVGVARAKELLLLGDEISGRTAADWGLIHRSVPLDEVDGVASALAQRLASGPTVAIGLTKTLIREGLDANLDAHLAREALTIELSTRSDDFKEGMRALAEKRAADFTGR